MEGIILLARYHRFLALFECSFVCNALFELQVRVSKISTNGAVADSQVCMQLFKVLPYKKCGGVLEKFDFLENTRFMTLEHLLKTF